MKFDAERELVAHEDQLSGSRLVQVMDGSGSGVRMIEAWSQAGIQLEVLPDRGFDLFTVRYRGIPVSWCGPSGLKPPTAYEPEGFGWLRTFQGGLVTTCGLDHFGGPMERQVPELHPPDDRVVSYGEHGRISHQSATVVRREIVDSESGPTLVLVGEVRQAGLYCEQYLLRREIQLSLTQPKITLTDRVKNLAGLPVRNPLLYHINLGYPLVAPGTVVSAMGAEGPISETFEQLTPTAPERVLEFSAVPNDDGQTRIDVASPDNAINLRLQYDPKTLPNLVVWKLPRTRVNVLGLAPSSAATPSEAPMLAPSETIKYRIGFEIVTE